MQVSKLRELLYSIQRFKHVERDVEFAHPQIVRRYASNSAQAMVLDLALQPFHSTEMILVKSL